MSGYEYKVVTAPRKGVAAKGIKGSEGKFANALSNVMNDLAVEGWEYQRSDTLPCDERQGLTGKTTKYHAMLIFRRPKATQEAPPLALPKPISVPTREEPVLRAVESPAPETTPTPKD